jgi:hypothetical protein
MVKTTLTFRVSKGRTPSHGSAPLAQVTPSGNTVVTVSRDAYVAALSAAAKILKAQNRPEKLKG